MRMAPASWSRRCSCFGCTDRSPAPSCAGKRATDRHAGRTSADPPSDAIVLFDGKISRAGKGKTVLRQVDNSGWLREVAPGTGEITTRAAFGDVQLHIEWATPRCERRGTGAR